jgi:hypothetical protein
MRASIAIVFLLAACSQGVPPIPKGKPLCDSPPPGEAMTKEQCECRGARVNASIGGGDQAHCGEGEIELGTVKLGIEGGWCCQKADAPTTPPAE